VVCLVDGQKDVGEEMCARAVGREVGLAGKGVGEVVGAVRGLVGGAAGAGVVGGVGLRGITKKTLGRVLKYRDEESKEAFVRKAVEHAVSLRNGGSLRSRLEGRESSSDVVYLGDLHSTNWRWLLRHYKSSLRANLPDQRSDHRRKFPSRQYLLYTLIFR